MARPRLPSEGAEALRARALDDLCKTSELITKRLELLEARETQWKALEAKLQENAAHAAEIIKLNVGGKIFCISKSHLLSVKGSYFHAMLAAGHWKPDSEGAYFIDRNSEQFDRVLDYLRTGKLLLDGLRPYQSQMLRETLDYLQLSPVGSARLPVAWDPQVCGKGLRLFEKNRVVVSLDEGQSVRSLDPCVRYSVRIDVDEADDSDVAIGFAPAEDFNPDRAMEVTCGWYLIAPSGELHSQEGMDDYGAGRIAPGSVVTCILNEENNSISFEVNGRSFGVAYTDIPDVDLYAALSFNECAVVVILED